MQHFIKVEGRPANDYDVQAMNPNQDQNQLDQTWKYRIKRWRRGLRARLSLWAARRYGTPQARPAPLIGAPERILVCRLNKRLGNVIFLTPLLASLAASFPKARIDVLVLDPIHADLLRGLPGIGQVWAPPAKPGLHLLALFNFIRRIRRRKYDLVIDPNAMSVSNRIGVLLSGATKRLGFAGEDQWLRLDYSAPFPHDVPHQALQALELFKRGFTQFEPTPIEHYRVAPGEHARQAADKNWRHAFNGKPPAGPVIGFFIQATGAKQLQESWWRDWLAAMQASEVTPTLVQLLPPGNAPALSPGLACLRVTALDELAATLAPMNLFVAADSGPMHLAAAAGVPTLGLFRATPADAYRPLGADCLTIHGDELTPITTAERVLAQLRRLPATQKNTPV